MIDLREISSKSLLENGKTKVLYGGYKQGLTNFFTWHTRVGFKKNELLLEYQVKNTVFPVTQTKFAEITGVTLPTVRAWVARGYVPTIRVGRRRLIDVAAYLRQIEDE